MPGGKCKQNRHGDMEYFPAKGTLSVNLDFKDFNTEYQSADKYFCRRVVMPADTYRGGGYRVGGAQPVSDVLNFQVQLHYDLVFRVSAGTTRR